MNDSMTAWMVKYISALKGGYTHDYILEICGVDHATFTDAKQNNAAFKNALTLAEAGLGATEMSAAELLRCLRAQLSDERTAAFFGLTVAEMMAKVNSSAELKRVFETGRLKGQAELQMTQHVVALTGDTQMLQFLGKQHLGQEDRKVVELTSESVGEMIRKLEQKLGRKGAPAIEHAVDGAIDAEFEEVGQLAIEAVDTNQGDE